MNKTREDLRAARAAIGHLVKKRGPTTEAELDECVAVLDELKRACGVAAHARTVPAADVAEFLSVMRESLNVVSERIKNRPKGQGASKP